MAAVWICLATAALGEEVNFQAAKPVWPVGRETEMNVLAGFRAVVTLPADQPAQLRVTASSLYRAWLNGEFLGYGPARGPYGWFRIDEWDLRGKWRAGTNVLAIEVAGYNINGFYLQDQNSFLQAEVVSGDRVLAATGRSDAGFQAGILNQRVL